MFPKADIHPVIFDEIYIKGSNLQERSAEEDFQKRIKEEKEKKIMNPLDLQKRQLE